MFSRISTLYEHKYRLLQKFADLYDVPQDNETLKPDLGDMGSGRSESNLDQVGDPRNQEPTDRDPLASCEGDIEVFSAPG